MTNTYVPEPRNVADAARPASEATAIAGAPDLMALRKAFAKFTTGVTIVTADSAGKLVGMTCNSFASVSLEPPLLLWSLRKASSSFDDFSSAEFFAVNILAGNQIELSGKFAKSGPDKFSGVPFDRGVGGAPILENTTATFECQVEASHDAGDHLIIIGKILRFSQSELAPMVFSDGRYVDIVERAAAKLPGSLASPTTDDPLHQYISVLLLRAFHRVLDHLAEARREVGLTANESRMLGVATAYPGRTLAALMPFTYMAESAMQDAVQTLKDRNYLSIDPDGRITATQAGLKSGEAYKAKMAALEAYLFRDLSKEQNEFFRQVLLGILASEPVRTA